MSDAPAAGQRNDLLTGDEVARELKVHVSTVMRWAASERIPAIRLPGKPVRFRRADVDALIAAGLTGTEAAS